MSQNAIWYDNLLDFFMLFVLIMQIGTQLGHEKVVKMDPFFGCLGYTEYQKGVVVEAQSWHLCTGSGFIPGKSQNTLELAIATGKCRKSLLAAEARLWPTVRNCKFKPGWVHKTSLTEVFPLHAFLSIFANVQRATIWRTVTNATFLTFRHIAIRQPSVLRQAHGATPGGVATIIRFQSFAWVPKPSKTDE